MRGRRDFAASLASKHHPHLLSPYLQGKPAPFRIPQTTVQMALQVFLEAYSSQPLLRLLNG